MIEGAYELVLNTPMGNIPCKICLWNEKDGLSGSIEMMGSKSFFRRRKS